MKRHSNIAAVYPFALASLLALAACAGAPDRESRQRSAAAGNEMHEVRGEQLSAVRHGNWHEAATGHAAAGEIPTEVLDHMEQASAPGGHFMGAQPEQGPSSAPSASPPSSASPMPAAAETSAAPASSPPPPARPHRAAPAHPRGH